MKSDAARSWLDGRDPAAPSELRSLVDEDLGGTRPLPERLAEAALQRLGAARRHSGERGAAFHLLAADAHLTYACEAAVDRPRADTEEGANPEGLFRSLLRRVADSAA